MRVWKSRGAIAYGAARLALRLTRAAWLLPYARTTAGRLASLPSRGAPVGAPVEIRWNEHLVPFVDAQSDRDLAVALGVVHAHLRLAQMELLRRVAQGRLAEAVGAAALRLDLALRTIDLGRAVPAIAEALPERTRDWLDGFVAGINHRLAAAVEPPLEFRLLGIVAAPWTVTDVLSIARLVGADPSWVLWSRLLPIRGRPEWPDTWARLLADGTIAMAGIAEGSARRRRAGNRGSNALAVAGRRSATGQGWLAGDPHLPLSLPSCWLIAGYRSPSYNLAGLMIPGLPAMVIGRNPFLAWGGTNLHAASSELFDVSALPPEAIRERRVRIAVRWSRPREFTVRETAYGPIVSDLPVFPARQGETLALRWVGHDASDELTALLAINRARDAASFRAAAGGIAVPGQTAVYADNAGRIGRISAAHLPRRTPAPPQDLVSPPAAVAAWAGLANSADFPDERDPPRGFVVSANERPPMGEIPIGWLFSPGERVERLGVLLGASERIGLAELAALQRDVAMMSAARLRDRLCGDLVPPPRDCQVFAALAAWDGRYEAGSAGALAFELVAARLIDALVPPPVRAMFGPVRHGAALLAEHLDLVPADRRAGALRAALGDAQSDFRRLRDWGGVNRLRLAHPLARLPVIGRRYPRIDFPWAGSNETLMKAAHAPVTGRHRVGFGSYARYLFDLSDPDANRLVILGGQDGVPGSAAFLDQTELFRRGEYIEVPLNPATARLRFPHSTRLEP